MEAMIVWKSGTGIGVSMSCGLDKSGPLFVFLKSRGRVVDFIAYGAGRRRDGKRVMPGASDR
jgi:hypothetical protein